MHIAVTLQLHLCPLRDGYSWYIVCFGWTEYQWRCHCFGRTLSSYCQWIEQVSTNKTIINDRMKRTLSDRRAMIAISVIVEVMTIYPCLAFGNQVGWNMLVHCISSINYSVEFVGQGFAEQSTYLKVANEINIVLEALAEGWLKRLVLVRLLVAG